MKRVLKAFLLACPGFFLVYTLSALSVQTDKKDAWAQHCLNRFLADSRDFALKSKALGLSIDAIDTHDSAALANARNALRQCRLSYKKVEYFMEYFFEYPVNLYNRAPVHEIEEPYMEYQAPVGLQVIEDLLYQDEVWTHKKALQDQAAVIISSSGDIAATAYGLHITDRQVAESIGREMIRVMALGISGYDAPLLKSGIQESGIALASVALALRAMPAAQANRDADSALYYIDGASLMLCGGKDFDRFNRMALLVQYLLPAQRHLNRYLREAFPGIGAGGAYNFEAEHLFRPDALHKEQFDPYAAVDTGIEVITLGKRLFFETRLSGNNSRSCASCHKPDQYFTDGLQGSITFDGKGATRRNAPSLLYGIYQYGQFLDARDSSLVRQVFTVLQNPDEMHSRLADIEHKLDDKAYRQLFKKAFPGNNKRKTISALYMARAIAAYERTLTPFNSSFDRYLAGNTSALTAEQINGFNLFMGKAQCGTCHFAPVFNGTLPPFYNRTELEILGTPGNGNLQQPSADKDSGRYDVFKIDFYVHAFKTPTVRNSSATAPYMHNGSVKTLDDLIEFYNRGGGAGIGLEVPSQTLSSRKLNLSEKEIYDIKSFLSSLKDSL